MVVAGPNPKPYYFVAECDDGRKLRSGEVTISSHSSYGRKFDLGTLVENDQYINDDAGTAGEVLVCQFCDPTGGIAQLTVYDEV